MVLPPASTTSTPFAVRPRPTAAMLPPVVREKLGLTFTERDRRRFATRVLFYRWSRPVVNPVVMFILDRLPYGRAQVAGR